MKLWLREPKKPAMQTVYIETSIISYLRARNSLSVTSVARQIVTRRWWDEERHDYQLVISQYVVTEASEGNPALAAERLAEFPCCLRRMRSR